MDWDDLKVVLAIHRTGSIARAARALGVDTSTATRRLAAIERDVGCVLFTRSKQGMRANDAGLVAIEEAIEIERRAERLEDRLPHRRGVAAGSVRLISNPWILTELASHGLAELRRDHPEIELVMIHATRRRSIAAGEADLGLWFEIAPGDGEFTVPVCDVVYAPYAPAGRDPDSVDWMTIWNVSERIAPMRWLAGQLPPESHIALKTNEPPALLGAIAAGLGKALIPACMGSRDPRLARMRDGMPDLPRRLHLYAHPDLVQSPRIQAVMAWIRAVAPRVLADPDAGSGARWREAVNPPA